MARRKQTYKVTGPFRVGDTEPGDTFTAEVDDDGYLWVGDARGVVAAMIEQGAIEAVDEKKSDK
jgi:acetamidase/formamidase